jgi:hypothetical protein
MLPRATKGAAEKIAAALARRSKFPASASSSKDLIQDLGMTPINQTGRRLLAEWMSLVRDPPPWVIAGPNGDDLVSRMKLDN